MSYLGLGLIATLLFALPFARSFTIVSVLFLTIGAARGRRRGELRRARRGSERDRGVAGTAPGSYRARMDVSSIVAPAGAGLVASIVGVFGMFSIVAAVAFDCFVAGDLAVAR